MNEPEPEQEVRQRVASRQQPDESKRIGMAAALERYYQAVDSRRPGRRQAGAALRAVAVVAATDAADPAAVPAD